MRVNEVKQTKTIEELVRTEYIAEDGVTFSNEEECKKYEESALFAISKELKRLTKDNTSQYEINDNFSCNNAVEIFDIQTERDLENLRRYLYLKMRKNKASEADVKECFTSKDGKRNKYVFDNVTVGHEVMIFWSYDEDWFWVYNDGSINGYCDFFRENIEKLIAPEKAD
ncbi:hypothetical protein [Agathobacter rectalis]|uniref:hypothetical protein n=1 Tax=Agathobacter rectalis TaxID=39491 RepID=UPI00321BC922